MTTFYLNVCLKMVYKNPVCLVGSRLMTYFHAGVGTSICFIVHSSNSKIKDGYLKKFQNFSKLNLVGTDCCILTHFWHSQLRLGQVLTPNHFSFGRGGRGEGDNYFDGKTCFFQRHSQNSIILLQKIHLSLHAQLGLSYLAIARLNSSYLRDADNQCFEQMKEAFQHRETSVFFSIL